MGRRQAESQSTEPSATDLAVAFQDAVRKRDEALEMLRARFWRIMISGIEDELEEFAETTKDVISCDNDPDTRDRVTIRARALLDIRWQNGALLENFQGVTGDDFQEYFKVEVLQAVREAWEPEANPTEADSVDESAFDVAPDRPLQAKAQRADFITLCESWVEACSEAERVRGLFARACLCSGKTLGDDAVCRCPTHLRIRKVMAGFQISRKSSYGQKVEELACDLFVDSLPAVLEGYDASKPFDPYFGKAVHYRVLDALRNINKTRRTNALQVALPLGNADLLAFTAAEDEGTSDAQQQRLRDISLVVVGLAHLRIGSPWLRPDHLLAICDWARETEWGDPDFVEVYRRLEEYTARIRDRCTERTNKVTRRIDNTWDHYCDVVKELHECPQDTSSALLEKKRAQVREAHASWCRSLEPYRRGVRGFTANEISNVILGVEHPKMIYAINTTNTRYRRKIS